MKHRAMLVQTVILYRQLEQGNDFVNEILVCKG